MSAQVNPPLQWQERVFTDTPMTRKQYAGVIGSILFIGVMLAWVMWPQPDYGSMGPHEKCGYSKYYSQLGGSEDECRYQVSIRRLNGQPLPEAFRSF